MPSVCSGEVLPVSSSGLNLTYASDFKFCSSMELYVKQFPEKKCFLLTVAARLSCLFAEADMPVCG